jgi:hypothetical protein
VGIVSEEDNEDERPSSTLQQFHQDTWKEGQSPQHVTFSLNGPADITSTRQPQVIPDNRQGQNQNEPQDNDSLELLKVHQKMNHTSFSKLQEMARQGTIPRRLAKCRIPLCTACVYSKQTRKPWRNKPAKAQLEKANLNPGEVVSVDQMVSPTHGFIAQMMGILTTQRYRYATIYIDQATKYGYVYLQKTATAEETLKGKLAWELHAQTMGISIKGYHADNGTFRANSWVNSCNASNQTLTFAVVNAHHQNGVAERRIRKLQELTCTSLIHANKRWPKCITAHLWLYALRMASNAFNHIPNLKGQGKQTPYSNVQ